MDINKISLGKVTTGLELSKPVVRMSDGEYYLEFEFSNTTKKALYDFEAQLRYYDSQNNFIGVDSDCYENLLEQGESWALEINCDAPEETSYAKLFLTGQQEYKKAEISKDITILVTILLLGSVVFTLLWDKFFCIACK